MNSPILKNLVPCIAAALLVWGCSGQRTDQGIVAGSRTTVSTREQALPRLPAGVETVSVEEVRELIVDDEDLVLVDTRPASRYRRSHLPGALSLPVAGAAAAIGRLQVDRDRLLVLYGEGGT